MIGFRQGEILARRCLGYSRPLARARRHSRSRTVPSRGSSRPGYRQTIHSASSPTARYSVPKRPCLARSCSSARRSGTSCLSRGNSATRSIVPVRECRSNDENSPTETPPRARDHSSPLCRCTTSTSMKYPCGWTRATRIAAIDASAWIRVRNEPTVSACSSRECKSRRSRRNSRVERLSRAVFIAAAPWYIEWVRPSRWDRRSCRSGGEIASERGAVGVVADDEGGTVGVP